MSRTWLVTGTSSGLGRLMTKKLLARGDRVAATARKVETLEDLKNEYGNQLWTASVDVTDIGALRATVNHAFTELARIDVVVSNAGYGFSERPRN